MSEVVLHGYFRSSASYRVRIALNLKGIDYANVFHHLRKGEQSAAGYRAVNPQGLVPALEWDGEVLTQSLAICEYLDEVRPDPALLPRNSIERARVRAFAQAIACEVHPLQNVKVLKRLKAMGRSQGEIDAWARGVIEEGFDACASLIEGRAGPFCFGASVTLADVFLIPQIANARRFGLDMSPWPVLTSIERECMALAAFEQARPENQPDAE